MESDNSRLISREAEDFRRRGNSNDEDDHLNSPFYIRVTSTLTSHFDGTFSNTSQFPLKYFFQPLCIHAYLTKRSDIWTVNRFTLAWPRTSTSQLHRSYFNWTFDSGVSNPYGFTYPSLRDQIYQLWIHTRVTCNLNITIASKLIWIERLIQGLPTPMDSRIP